MLALAQQSDGKRYAAAAGGLHDQSGGRGHRQCDRPDPADGARALGGAASKTSLLGAKVNELIALAVAVTARCDGCIVVHTDAAIKAGATREEIVEALGTGGLGQCRRGAGLFDIASARCLCGEYRQERLSSGAKVMAADGLIAVKSSRGPKETMDRLVTGGLRQRA